MPAKEIAEQFKEASRALDAEMKEIPHTTPKKRKTTRRAVWRRRRQQWSKTPGSDTDDSGAVDDPEQEGYKGPTSPGGQKRTFNLRPSRDRSYGHRYGHDDASSEEEEAALVHYAMTQYSLKAGLQKFKERGETAVMDEFKQIHDRDTFEPLNMGDLTEEQKRNALESLMFLKEKRCGRIKGRTCADGRKQRATSNKEDAASPTVAHESVMLTSVIDTMENRDVGTTDIPGAYLNADMDETVIM
eukprot:512930-Ditylum_brightwellii.AAC.1